MRPVLRDLWKARKTASNEVEAVEVVGVDEVDKAVEDVNVAAGEASVRKRMRRRRRRRASSSLERARRASLRVKLKPRLKAKREAEDVVVVGGAERAVVDVGAEEVGEGAVVVGAEVVEMEQHLRDSPRTMGGRFRMQTD